MNLPHSGQSILFFQAGQYLIRSSGIDFGSFQLVKILFQFILRLECGYLGHLAIKRISERIAALIGCSLMSDGFDRISRLRVCHSAALWNMGGT